MVKKTCENATALLKANSRAPIVVDEGSRVRSFAIEAFAAALAGNKTVESVTFTPSCEVDDEGAKLLAKALTYNSTLRVLCLSKNRIGEDGLQALGNALCQNRGLDDLDLSLNNSATTNASSTPGTDAVTRGYLISPAPLSRLTPPEWISRDAVMRVLGNALTVHSVAVRARLSSREDLQSLLPIVDEWITKNGARSPAWIAVRSLEDRVAAFYAAYDPKKPASDMREIVKFAESSGLRVLNAKLMAKYGHDLDPPQQRAVFERVRDLHERETVVLSAMTCADVVNALTADGGFNETEVEAVRKSQVDGATFEFLGEEGLKEVGISSAVARAKFFAFINRAKLNANKPKPLVNTTRLVENVAWYALDNGIDVNNPRFDYDATKEIVALNMEKDAGIVRPGAVATAPLPQANMSRGGGGDNAMQLFMMQQMRKMQVDIKKAQQDTWCDTIVKCYVCTQICEGCCCHCCCC